MIRDALARWVSLWDRREPPAALALTRILIAAVVLVDLAQARAHGLAGVLWASPAAGGVGLGADAGPGGPMFSRLFGVDANASMLLWTLAVVLAVLFGAGVLTRASGLLLVLVLAQAAHIAPDSSRGIDMLLRVAIAILVLSGSHATWSVDAWVRRRIGRPPPATVPAWPRYLLFAQLVWVYFSAAHAKLQGGWLSAPELSAVYTNLCDPHVARFAPGWMAGLFPLTQLATVATLVLEWTAPLLILATWCGATMDRGGRWRSILPRLRFRALWLALAVGFHCAIAATMQLGIFSYGVLAVYPVLFHPDELAGAWRWCRRRATSRKAAQAAGERRHPTAIA